MRSSGRVDGIQIIGTLDAPSTECGNRAAEKHEHGGWLPRQALLLWSARPIPTHSDR